MEQNPHTSPTVVKARVAIGDGGGPDGLEGLSPAERDEALRLGLGPHRRTEWRAGRRAAHAALGLLVGTAERDLVVGREDDGAPVVVGAPEVRISISHGKRWAVAAAGRVARLGVDLCEIARAPNVMHVATRFLHADERALPASPADWALLWALKEAAAKLLRRGLFDGGLAASRVAALNPARFTDPSLVVEVEVGDDDAVAVVYVV